MANMANKEPAPRLTPVQKAAAKAAAKAAEAAEAEKRWMKYKKTDLIAYLIHYERTIAHLEMSRGQMHTRLYASDEEIRSLNARIKRLSQENDALRRAALDKRLGNPHIPTVPSEIAK